MSKLATDKKAINLSQGYPDFEVDPVLISSVSKYMKHGFNQYAPMPGVLRLREVISKKLFKNYNQYYNEHEEITVTAGATQAILTTISALIHPNDEVIIFSPSFDCYQPAVELNGGIPIFIEMKSPDFNINWNTVEENISSKTRMIIINSPHNPLGTVLLKKDMINLERIAEKYDLLILSDEVTNI